MTRCLVWVGVVEASLDRGVGMKGRGFNFVGSVIVELGGIGLGRDLGFGIASARSVLPKILRYSCEMLWYALV